VVTRIHGGRETTSYTSSVLVPQDEFCDAFLLLADNDKISADRRGTPRLYLKNPTGGVDETAPVEEFFSALEDSGQIVFGQLVRYRAAISAWQESLGRGKMALDGEDLVRRIVGASEVWEETGGDNGGFIVDPGRFETILEVHKNSRDGSSVHCHTFYLSAPPIGDCTITGKGIEILLVGWIRAKTIFDIVSIQNQKAWRELEKYMEIFMKEHPALAEDLKRFKDEHPESGDVRLSGVVSIHASALDFFVAREEEDRLIKGGYPQTLCYLAAAEERCIRDSAQSRTA